MTGSMESYTTGSMKAHVLFSRAGLSTGILIESAGSFMLLDAGDGILRDLVAFTEDRDNRDFFGKGLQGITISHGHFDHVGGLWSILAFLRMIGRQSPLSIYIPKESEEPKKLLALFMEQYPNIPFGILIHEVTDRHVAEEGGFWLIFRDMAHSGSVRGKVLPRLPAFGISVRSEGERIVFSGDTGDCPQLRELVEGADLALIEATFDKTPDDPTVTERVHLTETLAAEIGSLAKEHVLIHRS